MVLLRRIGALSVGLTLSGCTLLLDYGDEAQLAGRPDAAAADAAPVVDGGADGPAMPFCQSLQPRPAFCASFDGPGYLAEWSNSRAAGARLERDTDSSLSPPASLRITAEPGGAEVAAEVGTDFAGTGGGPFTAVIGFGLDVVEATPTGALAVVATPLVLSANGQPAYLLQLVARPLADGSSISLEVVEVSNEGGGDSRGHPANVSLQRGSWSQVELTVVRGDAGSSVSLTVDGQSGLATPLELALPRGVMSSSFGLATVGADTTAWSYRFDNVTVDLR